ncbi:MAG: tryptophan synthase alpha chain [Frankiaceae bacterium]|nr:tryptophan synthase alpha chain [Frankiaceae bacterium]
MSALGAAFAAAKAEDRALLVGYLPAGFARPETFAAMVSGGVDVVEVGLPYSDPLMDGPTIQEAARRALELGCGTRDVLDTVAAVAATGAPTVVMTYWNPVEHYGVERFARDLAAAGGAGAITPDLIPDEAGPWLDAARANALDPVFLVAPSSTEARLRVVAGVNGGFVYAASTMGVTGTREAVSTVAPALVHRVREVTSLPVAVGLGVSNGRQAAAVAAYADGVIVGSAFVRAVLDAQSPTDANDAVAALAADLAAGCRDRG